MTAKDLEYGAIVSVDLVPSIGDDLGFPVQSAEEAHLSFNPASPDVLVKVKDHVFSAIGASAADAQILANIATRNLPKICWTLTRQPKVGPTRRLSLQIHEFPASYSWPGDVDIAVDDRVVEDLRRKRRTLLTLEQVVDWLTEKLLLSENGRPMRVMLSGSSLPNDSLTAFRLLGRGFAIDVKADAESRLRITRIVESRRPRRNDESRPILLIESNIRFVDATIAGEFRGTAKSLLDELVQKSTSYLNLWKEYNAIERESAIRRARSFGSVRYSKCALLPDGRWRFQLIQEGQLGNVFDQLTAAEDLELEAAPVLPAELASLDKPDEGSEREARQRAFSGIYRAADRQRLSIDVLPPSDFEDVPPPIEGVLFPSLTGDRRRLERREDAQARIASATCAMPQLGLLIEGHAVPERRSRGIDPSESKYRGLIRNAIGGEPTTRQLEAIRVALNTPDVCLIQGPPGTGKTRVIAALQAVLAELEESRTEVAGRTLLTSYQHDAVENVASRTSVFGLPAIKIGKRRDQSGEVDGFNRWRLDRAEEVRADLSQSGETSLGEVLRGVESRAVGYLSAPMPNEELSALLRTIWDLAAEYLSPELKDRLLSSRQNLDRKTAFVPTGEEDDVDLALQAVRGIRTEEESFADDGAHQCVKALMRVQPLGLLQESHLRLLICAGEWSPAQPLDFLPDLTRLKGDLLDTLSRPKEITQLPQINAEIEQLLSDIVATLYQKIRGSVSGVQEVLWEYRDALENDVDAVRETIKGYTVVLAATCQQAASKRMSDLKAGGPSLSQLNELDRPIVFKDVIIDEAARANPLDLFVPMALAERRIVLVGDHRQLPHILEPDVEREIERSVHEETRDVLKKSLFERLFEDLRSREPRDGIKRTVTLNLQFRMHPVLGQFVSDTFYKPYGEEFESVQDDVQFAHDLDRYQNKVAAWVNCPRSLGPEQRARSKRRPSEARWIAAEVLRLAQQRPDLSFGVITFYAAQRDELLKAMEAVGIAETTDAGNLEIREAWRETTGTRRERIRVGTVDAFQGKEFDVVILSMTRSNDLPGGNNAELRKKYGHLMLDNRLCVAMSRQHRLLIVVGDAEMVLCDHATSAIPALLNFHELCGGTNGVRLSV